MISIIIPTYNSAKTIKRCLDSIVAQTCKDYEVLVMDGMSKDDTLSLVQSYNDPRIHIYSEPDKGIYDAMNKGILKSKGEWLYFLGSDDYLFEPDVLEKVAKELTPEYKIVYGDVDSSHLPNENRGEWTTDVIQFNRCHQAIFYRKDVFEEYGLYDLSYKVYADFIYNVRCFWLYNLSTKYIKVIVAHFSDGGASSTDVDPQFDKDIELLYLKVGKRHLTISQRKEFARRAIRNTDSWTLKCMLKVYVGYLRVAAKFGIK